MHRKKKIGSKILWLLCILIISFVMLAPFYWMISTSLKTVYDAVKVPPVWFPNPPQFSNYFKLFQEQPLIKFIINTVKIVVIVLIGQLFFSSLAAYAFARIKFIGRNILFFIYIGTMMVPTQVTLIPTYLLFAKVGITDSHIPLILPSFFTAFGVFLLRQFFLSLPMELEEAAKIDGCNRFQIYWRIMLPLIKPALMTLAVFTFMNVWNDYMGPLIYLTSVNKYTISLGIAFFKGTYTTSWNLMMAGAVVSLIPILIFYLTAQKYFEQGIAFSGIKG